MNDYTRGALEAISWAILVLKKVRDKSEALAEMEAVRDAILGGVAVNFHERIKYLYP
jgi:hypothetical protein